MSAQVAAVVELREPGEAADDLAARLRADHEAGARRAVVGAASRSPAGGARTRSTRARARGRRGRSPRGRAGRRAATRATSWRSPGERGQPGSSACRSRPTRARPPCSGRPACEHRRDRTRAAARSRCSGRSAGQRDRRAEGRELLAQAAGRRHRPRAPGSGRRRSWRGSPMSANASSIAVVDGAPHARPRSRTRPAASTVATGTSRAASDGLQVPAERQALQRVVGRAVAVEVAAEPAPAAERVELADLPVVTAREVRLVGIGVADRRQHGDLPLGVSSARPASRRVPAQAGVLARTSVPCPRPAPSVGPQRGVARVARLLRGEHRERVDPAGQEDRDQHRSPGACADAAAMPSSNGAGPARGAVDGEREAGSRAR